MQRCNSSQLRWIACPQTERDGLVSPHTSLFYRLIKYQKSCCTVDSHWDEARMEEICRNNANHIIFLPSLSDSKNSWRAWMVLKILFQPLSHTGPRPLRGSHWSGITGSHSRLHTTPSESLGTWKNTTWRTNSRHLGSFTHIHLLFDLLGNISSEMFLLGFKHITWAYTSSPSGWWF